MIRFTRDPGRYTVAVGLLCLLFAPWLPRLAWAGFLLLLVLAVVTIWESFKAVKDVAEAEYVDDLDYPGGY